LHDKAVAEKKGESWEARTVVRGKKEKENEKPTSRVPLLGEGRGWEERGVCQHVLKGKKKAGATLGRTKIPERWKHRGGFLSGKVRIRSYGEGVIGCRVSRQGSSFDRGPFLRLKKSSARRRKGRE